MTAAQEKLYWREWGAVRKASPEADRHDLHVRALGREMSHKAFGNAEFDLVLGAFRAVSRPAALDAHLRQQAQPRRRVEHRLAEIQQCLGLYVEDVAGYIAQVVSEKFSWAGHSQVTLDDLSDKPRITMNPVTGQPEEKPSQVVMLLITLWARLQPLRRARGHSLHEMRTLAGVECYCAVCNKRRRLPVVLAESRLRNEQLAARGQEVKEPF